MNITLEQWTAIEAKIQAVRQAIDSLENTLFEFAIDHNQAGNQEEGLFLIDLATKIVHATEGKELLPYFYHPQPEWTGGDSSDERNFAVREPHIVGSFPKRLEKEEEASRL